MGPGRSVGPLLERGLALKVKKGRHSFEVRAIDEVGNFDPSPAKFSFNVKRKKRNG